MWCSKTQIQGLWATCNQGRKCHRCSKSKERTAQKRWSYRASITYCHCCWNCSARWCVLLPKQHFLSSQIEVLYSAQLWLHQPVLVTVTSFNINSCISYSFLYNCTCNIYMEAQAWWKNFFLSFQPPLFFFLRFCKFSVFFLTNIREHWAANGLRILKAAN